MRRTGGWMCGWLLMTAVLVTPCQAVPNIVLIYGDDVGFGDVGCYGAKSIPTPNIDRLAQQGLRFTSGYCTSATCTPSRYSLLTGQYAWRVPGTGIAPPNATALIKPGTPTLASVLKNAGYRTGIVGKWHLGLGSPPKPDWSGEIKPGPLEIGFDSSFIIPTTNDRVPCVYVDGHHIVNLDPADPVDVFRKNPDGQPTGITARDSLKLDWSVGHNNSIVNGIGRIGFMTGGEKARWKDETMAQVLTQQARKFIADSTDKPFFLYYAAHQIHVPRAPNPQFVGKTPHGARGDAMVEFDWCVGQIVDELDRAGKLDDTLILFTSDNGPVLDDGYQDQAVEKLGDHQPAGPYRGGKYSRYEGGTRVPWIVHWPARVQPGTTDAMISQVDLVASLAPLADVYELPEGAAPDSMDLSEVLIGESKTGREYIIEHSGSRDQLAILQGHWKYIPGTGGRAPQLYNLESDIDETENVAKGNQMVAAKLADLLQAERNKGKAAAESN